MSSTPPAEDPADGTVAGASAKPPDASGDNTDIVDNNNKDNKDKEEEMDTSANVGESETDGGPQEDGKSCPAEESAAETEKGVPQEDAEMSQDAGSTTETAESIDSTANVDPEAKEESGAMDFILAPEESEVGESPRGRGRGRPRGRGKLSPRAKSSPRGRKKRRAGRSIGQADFKFPDSSADNAFEIKRPGINVVDLPNLMKPFDEGWTREHVVRGSAEDHDAEPGRKASDVYYFPPSGRKIRSMVEITDYLIMNDITTLSTECFSFARCTIYKAPMDVSRYSKQSFSRKFDSPKHAVPKNPVSPLVVKLPVPKKDTPVESVSTAQPTKIKIVAPGMVKVRAVAKKRTGGGKRVSNTAMAGPLTKKPSLMAGYNPRLCGMECPNKQGVPPELHCKMCMCLFHADCVGYTGKGNDFTCPECTRIDGMSGHVNGSGMPPLHLGPVQRGTAPGKDGIRQLPALTRIAPAPPEPQINLLGTFNVRPPPTLNAISSHVITLPQSVVGKIKMDAPLTLKTDGKDLVIPPSCMIATPTGMKVFLPPGVLSSIGVETGLAKAINIMPNPSNPQTMSVVSPGTVEPSKDSIVIPEVKILNRTKVKVMTRKYPGTNPAACFVQKLNAGIICCRKIFQFLGVQDRLRAAQVCQTWKDILNHRLFWEKVKLRDSTVMDWEKAAEFLRDNNTKVLDMRGMVHPNNDKNRTWHQFTGELGKMTQLQQIHFDQCPVQILQGVAEKLTGLRSLSAQFLMDAVLSNSQMWSTPAKIDFNKFKGMSELEELRIRGACGLVLLNGLAGLHNLRNMKTLSLATLKEVKDEDFKFMENFTSLEELELGDCDGMAGQGFTQLEKLMKLKRIRLESRPEVGSSLAQLGKSLQALKQLKSLELIKFALNEEILQELRSLNLKQLTLWPETGAKAAEINTAVYKMVQEMKSLESFEWAIMGDQILSGSENPDRHHQNESILMLKDAEGTRVADIREISEKLFSVLPNAKIRVFRIGVPVLAES